jgi:hypothetical protein
MKILKLMSEILVLNLLELGFRSIQAVQLLRYTLFDIQYIMFKKEQLISCSFSIL